MNSQTDSYQSILDPQAKPQTKRPRASKIDALAPFHEQIIAWRHEDMDLRAIAAHIVALGCPVRLDHNVVARYCKRHGIPTCRNTKATTSSPADAVAQMVNALSPAPEQEAETLISRLFGETFTRG